MRISEIVNLLEADVLYGDSMLDKEIRNGCGSDLMSDVLAFAKSDSILLTGLVNCQVLRTAEMMDFRAIVFVRGKRPDESILKLAKENEIVIMSTKKNLYFSCGILYSNGLNELESGVCNG
jgi:predicted transcriptional regulator